MVETTIQQDGPPVSPEIWIKLHADTSDQITSLSKITEEFKSFLEQVPWTKNVKSSSEDSPWEFIFTLNREKLALLGVSQKEIAPELYFSLNGLKAWNLKGKRETYDLKIKYADFQNQVSPEGLMGATFITKNGKIPLGALADYSLAPATSKIIRENGNITITISANLQKKTKAEPINAKLMQFAESYPFPEGISYEKWGETEENSDLLIAMLSAFIFALICIFGILVLQFNSYTQPGIILYSVVMGFLGATYGMRITWNPYGMLFLIWFIALTGIVVNNAIILIDTANENCKQGESRLQAMKESAKSRLKPILSTTLTTVIGLATLTSDWFFAPLAWTIIFGLSIATMMTLFVIPALYEDEHIIRYLIKRIVLKPLLKILVPGIGLGAVRACCIILKIPLFESERSQPFSFSFIIASILCLSWYGYSCNLKGKSWFIQKILKLRLVTNEGTIITKKALIKREVIKRGMVLFPALFGWIVLAIGNNQGIGRLEMLWTGILGGSYLILIFWNLYTVWTSKEKQTRRDKRSGTQMEELEQEK